MIYGGRCPYKVLKGLYTSSLEKEVYSKYFSVGFILLAGLLMTRHAGGPCLQSFEDFWGCLQEFEDFGGMK